MRDMGKAIIGVAMRPCKRISIRLSGHRPFGRSGIRAADRLCERCFKPGRCVNDAHEGHRHVPADEPRCPGWCELLSHLEDRVLPKAPDASFDSIPF